MIKIKINGTEYKNVGSVEPSVEYDYYYDIVTMSGKRHRDVKGKRTNYTITFFNINIEEYMKLKKTLLNANTVILEVPNDIAGEFIPTVSKDKLKGMLNNGKWYSTGLEVSFERVGYDEE